jgi:hypothetical protein
MLLFLLHEALAGALFYSIFCRAISTCMASTRLSVLVAFWIMGCVDVALIAAPFVSQWAPNWLTCALLASVVTVQWVTAEHWRDGVPEPFRRSDYAFCERLESNSGAMPGQAADRG